MSGQGQVFLFPAQGPQKGDKPQEVSKMGATPSTSTPLAQQQNKVLANFLRTNLIQIQIYMSILETIINIFIVINGIFFKELLLWLQLAVQYIAEWHSMM